MSIQPMRNPAAPVNRRRSERVHSGERQLRVKSGKQEGQTGNFSQDGFLADGLDDYQKNDTLEGTLHAPDGGQARFSGKVVRVEEDGMRAVQLVNFDSAALLMFQSADAPSATPVASASSRAYLSANKESGDSNRDS
jgi:hypothetical protein